MEIDYTILGNRIGYSKELTNAMNQPVSRTQTIKLGSRIPKLDFDKSMVTIQGLRNGQMADARENLSELLKMSREKDKIDEEKNFEKLAGLLAGYYSFDSQQLAEGQKQLRDEYNMENTRDLIKSTLSLNPDAKLEDIQYQENYPRPKTVVTYSAEEEKFINSRINDLQEAGIQVPMSVKQNLVKQTPALIKAIQNGYTNLPAMYGSINAFRKLGRDVFTEADEDAIKAKTNENIAMATAEKEKAKAKPNAGAGESKEFVSPIKEEEEEDEDESPEVPPKNLGKEFARVANPKTIQETYERRGGTSFRRNKK